MLRIFHTEWSTAALHLEKKMKILTIYNAIIKQKLILLMDRNFNVSK